MKIRYIILMVVFAIILSTSAYATDISVPSWNHPSWSAAKMAPGGTCYRGAAYQYWPGGGATVYTANAPFGDSPFAETCGGSSNLGTVNYGTDLFKGKALADVVRLEYSVYMYDVAHLPWTASMSAPVRTEYGDGQAWGLEFIANKGDGNARVCVFTPGAVTYNSWVTIDALASGTWYNATTSTSTAQTWTSLKGTMLANSSMWNAGITASTNVRSFGAGTAAMTSVTGKQFNFLLGNRTANFAGSTSYWNRTFNSAGMIGSLTVQFAGESEATTYNFVPEPSAILPLVTGLLGFVALRRRVR